MSVPLVVQTQSGLVPASHYPRSVRITLRGEDDAIRSIAEGDITAIADFTRFDTNGWHRSPVQIRKEGGALGVEPLEISVTPFEVSVQLDWYVSKNIPLMSSLTGRTVSGFDLTEYSISPREVMVSGPADVLETLTELVIEPVDLQGRNSDFSLIVNIVNNNPFVSVRGNRTAEFRGVIRPVFNMRSIESVPVVLTGLDAAFEIETENITGSVQIGGDQGRLDNFIPQWNFLSVDVSGLTEPGTFTLPVFVNLSYGLALVRHSPDEITITVAERQAEPEANADTADIDADADLE